MEIIPLSARHWQQVRAIYEEGIATGNATFQTAAPTWEEWDKGHRTDCRLIAIEDGLVLGWAAISPVSSRPVYAGVAEVSIYIATEQRGKGIGKTLLRALIEASEEHQYWTLQAGIFPENIASIRLHEQFGFRIVGTRERIGQMDNRWRDTVLLERRSKRAGL